MPTSPRSPNRLDLSAWPRGTRAICRGEVPHARAQLTFTDADGYRFQPRSAPAPTRAFTDEVNDGS